MGEERADAGRAGALVVPRRGDGPGDARGAAAARRGLGCLNYWEAGNWALNEQAEPVGPKTGRRHRSVHLHLLGRSRAAGDPCFRWGEAPIFPLFADRYAWAATHARLTADECASLVARTEALLVGGYGLDASQVTAWSRCDGCRYPVPAEAGGESTCAECRAVR